MVQVAHGHHRGRGQQQALPERGQEFDQPHIGDHHAGEAAIHPQRARDLDAPFVGNPAADQPRDHRPVRGAVAQRPEIVAVAQRSARRGADGIGDHPAIGIRQRHGHDAVPLALDVGHGRLQECHAVVVQPQAGAQLPRLHQGRHLTQHQVGAVERGGGLFLHQPDIRGRQLVGLVIGVPARGPQIDGHVDVEAENEHPQQNQMAVGPEPLRHATSNVDCCAGRWKIIRRQPPAVELSVIGQGCCQAAKAQRLVAPPRNR